MPHRTRPPFEAPFPVHVTLRLRDELPSLRTSVLFDALRKSFIVAKKPRFRICQFSVQESRVDFICEADDATALTRGVQGFKISVARRLNTILRRSSRLWDDRYDAEILRTPNEVRHALCYVLQNHRLHSGRTLEPGPDAYSSGPYFDGWREPGAMKPAAAAEAECPVATATTWLLTEGWRSHGLIGRDEVPGPLA